MPDNASSLTLAPPLTAKQRLFVDAFLGEAKGNATQAARHAGYSDPNGASSHVLRQPGVRAAIDAAVTSSAMGREEVLERLTAFARLDPSNFITIDKDGVAKPDLAKAERLGQLHLLEELSWVDGVPKLKFPSRLESLRILAKFHGLLVDKVEVTQTSNPESIRAELRAKLFKACDGLPDSERAKLGLPPKGLPGPAEVAIEVDGPGEELDDEDTDDQDEDTDQDDDVDQDEDTDQDDDSDDY